MTFIGGVGTEEARYNGNENGNKDQERNTPMRKLKNAVMNFLKREDGPTAVEYAVMLALIIVVCIAAISALGSNSSNTFNYVANTVKTTSS
jgi:pilus assembly protein Flp/PilA